MEIDYNSQSKREYSKSGWLANRKLPCRIRIPIEPNYCPEEQAIIKLVNGDIGLDTFLEEVEKANFWR